MPAQANLAPIKVDGHRLRTIAGRPVRFGLGSTLRPIRIPTAHFPPDGDACTGWPQYRHVSQCAPLAKSPSMRLAAGRPPLVDNQRHPPMRAVVGTGKEAICRRSTIPCASTAPRSCPRYAGRRRPSPNRIDSCTSRTRTGCPLSVALAYSRQPRTGASAAVTTALRAGTIGAFL